MKRILAALVATGLMAGAIAASHAMLPPAPAKSEQQKVAEARKAAAEKVTEADLLNKAQEKAVANYKKNGGAAMKRDARKGAVAEPTPGTSAPNGPGADHAEAISPQHEPTRQQEATAMPLPGQATGEL